MASCAARPCATGIIRSRSPQTISVGTCAARYRRSEALTRWPPESTIVRSVWTNAWRASAAASERKPRQNSSRSDPARNPMRPKNRAMVSTASPTFARAEKRENPLGAGKSGRAQQQVDLAPETPARHQDQALAAIRELVGKLHRHAAPERVSDDGGPLVAQHAE